MGIYIARRAHIQGNTMLKALYETFTYLLPLWSKVNKENETLQAGRRVNNKCVRGKDNAVISSKAFIFI